VNAVCVIDTRCVADGAAMNVHSGTAKDTTRSVRSWAFVVFFVSFVFRCFYTLAIRRCKPGPAKWP
jgi:hypothetical protein